MQKGLKQSSAVCEVKWLVIVPRCFLFLSFTVCCGAAAF
jgi:hypothetical protein